MRPEAAIQSSVHKEPEIEKNPGSRIWDAWFATNISQTVCSICQSQVTRSKLCQSPRSPDKKAANLIPHPLGSCRRAGIRLAIIETIGLEQMEFTCSVTRERRRHRRLGHARINVIGKIEIRPRFNVVRFGDLHTAWITDKWTEENWRSRVKVWICGRRERILGMRVAVSDFPRQRKVKVCTEAAMSSIDRSWIKFLARRILFFPPNSMDEKKRGVVSDQRSWEASLQEASTAWVLWLFSLSDPSSLIMIDRTSLGSWTFSRLGTNWVYRHASNETLTHRKVHVFSGAKNNTWITNFGREIG